MGEHDNTVFVEEVRTELMSMFTGMALQGLAGQPVRDAKPINTGRLAVQLADATITALEEYHLRRKDELIAARNGQQAIDLGNIQ